jgi:hypothetical protein
MMQQRAMQAGQVVQPQYFGIAGGGTGMPPIGGVGTFQISDPFMPRPTTQPPAGGFGATPRPTTQPPAGGFGAAPQPMTQPPAGGFGAAPQPMTQPPAGGFGAPPPPPPPPAPGMAMGGSVGMAPPNPYAQQIGQEDPRMQAMRYMQQMNFGG